MVKKWIVCGAIAALVACTPGLANASTFQVRQTYLSPTSTGNASGGAVGGQLENVDEAEALLAGANGFTPVGNFTGSPSTINYAGANFPGSAGLSGESTNDFALEAVGVVTLTTGTTRLFNLYINSNEGFRLRQNGTLIAEFFGQTTASNTTIINASVSNGDVFRLTFFDRAGAESLQWRVNGPTGAFVGDPTSGININPVPEPAATSLAFAAAGGLLLRRRRPV